MFSALLVLPGDRLRAKDARLIKTLTKKINFLTAEEGGGGASKDEVEKLRSKYKEVRDALDEEEDKNATLRSKLRRSDRDVEEKTDHIETLQNEVKELREKVRRYKTELALKVGGRQCGYR